MGRRRTAVAWAVARWSLPPVAAETQSAPSAEDSLDTRLARLQRIIERQQKIIDTLEERVGDLEPMRVCGRGVGASNAQTSAAGATTATQSPLSALVTQSGNTAPASKSTTAVRPDPDGKPRIQNKDLVFQFEHAPLFG